MTTTTNGLNLIFAGTPDFAAHHLQALIDHGQHNIVAVYTQPDRPAGRGKKLSPSAVKRCAMEHGLPVYQPLTLKAPEVQVELAAHKADLMIVVAYGLLLPQAVLDIPVHGCFNVHGSLLPRWRGAAPIQRSLAAGDEETGITIMQMDRGLDTGDMLLKRRCPITPDDTSASLHDKLMVIGAEALIDTLDLLQNDALEPEKQDDNEASYAEKITKEEARIDWSQSAKAIHTNIRAYNPFPIAYSELKNSRIKIYQAEVDNQAGVDAPAGEIVSMDSHALHVACGQGVLSITAAQLPNKKVMAIRDILNGKNHPFGLGERFEQVD